MELRRVAYLASVVTVATAAVAVPAPGVEVAPGSARSITELVTLDTEVTEVTGTYDLLTIRIREPSLAESLLIWLDPERDLEPPSRAVPDGVDEDDYRRLQRAQFTRSFQTAVAVGAREAGFDTELTTRPVVFQVIPGGPSDGVLDVGDVVRAVDGVEVTSAADLVDVLRDNPEPGPLEIVTFRGDDERVVEVVTRELPGLDQPGLGIVLDTVAEDVDLPFGASLESTRIGGPSAGLMIALATYDLLSPEDLARGRVIAGTGTIEGDGGVGRIAGVGDKVTAAQRGGADVVLVPREQLDEALARADGSVRVVGVDTLAEAVEALRA